ncbi:penicillin-binding protein 2 [Calidifontibacter terrae]
MRLRRDDITYPSTHRGTRRSPYVARIGALFMVALLVFGVLIGRLFQLQVVDGPQMRAAAQQINTRTVTTAATRGRILAVNGTPLVTNTSITMLTVDPTVLADSKDHGRALFTRIQGLLGGDPIEMMKRTMPCGSKGAPTPPVCFAGSPVEPIPILRNVDSGRAMTLLERPEEFRGVSVVQVPVRQYPAPDNVNAAQLLGYLGSTNGADLAANKQLTASDLIGRAGLERSYDTVLRGTPGSSVLAVDARGLPVRTVSTTDPTAGRDVVTNLEVPVQRAAEDALSTTVARLKAAKSPVTGAAAVVLDASSGGIVAMASNPSYDPNVWTGGISSADYAALSAPTAHNPLLNRVVGQLQPPASTFKGITLPAAISSGVDPNGTYDCSSSVRVGARTFKNFESVAFGPINMTTALEVSCDTVFYRWAFQRWQAEGGINAAATTDSPFVDSARSFHLGQKTGVDLPGESAGVIPSRAWKVQRWNDTKATSCRRATSGYPEVKDKTQAAYFTQLAKENCAVGYQWQAGDAVNFAIGQGDVLVTPLQMATAYGAIANGGTLWQPRVVAATRAPDGSTTQPVTPKRIGEVAIPAAAQPVLAKGLSQVVTGSQGTAYAAFRGFPLDTYPLSGKTGTGEVYGKDATAWFVSYGPKLKNGKQYVVAVMVEQGGTGASAAAPTARAIWDVLRTLSPAATPAAGR